jgi:clan AA aspartic protease (TIGR02281 family)
MFQIVLSLIAGILIGWNFHLFYMALEPKKCIENNQTIISKLINQPKSIAVKSMSSNQVIEKVIPKETNITNESNFENLLNSGNFSDAMAFYLEADEKQLKEYRLILKVYFYDNADKEPQKTIEEILQYIDLEPKSQDFKLYLAKIYRDKKEFQKALELLFELKDTQNSKIVDSDLNITIENYVKHLEDSKDFAKLISFFEEMINNNRDNEKYIIRLAKIYNELDNYEESKKLLEDITDDSIYNTNAHTILKNIENKEKELQHYTHIIPLKKIGSQYSIDLKINQSPVTLLLDTGASYTFIDSDKIPSLILEKEILLNTAGGDIIAHLAKADTLSIGDLELKNFKVTIAPFKRQHSDGLLGMNFFEKFDFKINQNSGVLYLGEKRVNNSSR